MEKVTLSWPLSAARESVCPALVYPVISVLSMKMSQCQATTTLDDRLKFAHKPLTRLFVQIGEPISQRGVQIPEVA